MTARADTAEQRFATYRGLVTRNRLVAVLRVAVPVLGAIVFIGFVAQVFIASLGSQFGIGKVSFSGDTITVDTPTYSGVMANGDVYKVSAAGATTAVTDLNTINMKEPVLRLTKGDGTEMTAKAATGAFRTLTQVMTVPGVVEVSDTKGNAGTLEDVVVNLPKQTLKAAGRARISMAGGMTIDAEGLDYDARTSVWTFGHSSVELPQTPGNDAADDGGDTP